MRSFIRLFATALVLSPLPAMSETWLFAAAACPPWKEVPGDPETTQKMADACGKDLDLTVSGFQQSMGISDDRIIVLLNEQATGEGVSAALTQLAKEAAPDDRVILYINIHGGQAEALYKGYEVKDQVFAWYTPERPADPETATANGDWMSARTFRDLANKIMAHEIVTVIEACHAGAALDDYINNVHDGIGGRGDDWPGREAVIFSAFGSQIANFNPDGTMAIFTEKFSQTLGEHDNRTLFDAFEEARVETHRAVRDNCAGDHSLKDLVDGWSSYRELCTQMPNAWDPFGLLDDIALSTRDFGAHDGL